MISVMGINELEMRAYSSHEVEIKVKHSYLKCLIKPSLKNGVLTD